MTACSALPGSGPTTSQVMDQAAAEPKRFHLVEIEPSLVALAPQTEASFRDQFGSPARPPGSTIVGGDRVAVLIWQENQGQFAPPRETPDGQVPGPITIPEQVVGADGAISVPFAGRIQCVGRTPFQVQVLIEERLAKQLIKPQVVITVTKAASNSVTVSGEQVTGARVPLTGGGDRLLDVIAAAGGSKAPIYETSIRLTRQGQTASLPMSMLVSDPNQDIFVLPGDVIVLTHTPHQFSVFGATGTNNQVPFGSERLDLAQAIARAGGLSDQRADPNGVFLFRFEPDNAVDRLRLPRLGAARGEGTPVLYHLDLKQVDSYFLAKRFPVLNNDLIYVANAPLTELQKFFTLIGTITGPVIGGAVVARGVTN